MRQDRVFAVFMREKRSARSLKTMQHSCSAANVPYRAPVSMSSTRKEEDQDYEMTLKTNQMQQSLFSRLMNIKESQDISTIFPRVLPSILSESVMTLFPAHRHTHLDCLAFWGMI